MYVNIRYIRTQILKLIIEFLYFIYLHTSRKKIADLKNGFLRIFFWGFIEVKWTILYYHA